jgi:Co/Zn/Cd efflux system component
MRATKNFLKRCFVIGIWAWGIVLIVFAAFIVWELIYRLGRKEKTVMFPGIDNRQLKPGPP